MAARHVSVARVLGLFRPYAGRIALVFLLIALASAAGLAAPIGQAAQASDLIAEDIITF